MYYERYGKVYLIQILSCTKTYLMYYSLMPFFLSITLFRICAQHLRQKSSHYCYNSIFFSFFFVHQPLLFVLVTQFSPNKHKSLIFCHFDGMSMFFYASTAQKLLLSIHMDIWKNERVFFALFCEKKSIIKNVKLSTFEIHFCQSWRKKW